MPLLAGYQLSDCPTASHRSMEHSLIAFIALERGFLEETTAIWVRDEST
jgi:hypothetical protein